MNVAVTEALDYIATTLEKAVKGGKTLQAAVATLLPQLVKAHKRIVFNGNNYSDAWAKEAGKRGLLNLKNTVDALPQLVTKEAIALFEKYKVLNSREVHARYEIMLETYNKTINVEGQLMVLMANRYILPAALEYQKNVAQSVTAVKQAGGTSAEGKKLLGADHEADRQAGQAVVGARARARPRRRRRGQARQAHARQGGPGHGGAARDRRRARNARPARQLAARHLSRDALHQMTRESRDWASGLQD